MKEIVIVSGKGGTGKTVIAGSFAVLAKNKVMGDCDVDASNLYLLLHPEIKESMISMRSNPGGRFSKMHSMWYL